LEKCRFDREKNESDGAGVAAGEVIETLPAMAAVLREAPEALTNWSGFARSAKDGDRRWRKMRLTVSA
jgi:hypothetical protein